MLPQRTSHPGAIGLGLGLRLGWLLALLAIPHLSCAQEKGEETQPNILIVLVDDVGYGDLGYMGHPIVRTPNLDKFAREGIRFEQFYAGGPNCSPSRASLLTGRAAYRVGVFSYIRHDTREMTLPESETTLAEVLRDEGYDTFHAGKWHLTRGNPEHGPQQHGFTDSVHKNATATELVDDFQNWLETRESGKKPFFSLLALYETHDPVGDYAPEEFVRGYGDEARQAALQLPNGRMPENKRARSGDAAKYFGSLSQMDAAFGTLLKGLERKGLRENTIILFASDNGPEHRLPESFGSPGPLFGAKGHMYEGGIRIPAVMQWPMRWHEPRRITEPLHFADVMPSLCDLAEIGVPQESKLDGVSFLPALEGLSLERSSPLYWALWSSRSLPQFAMREGDWKILAAMDPVPVNRKIIAHIKAAPFRHYELYNLADDPLETTDLKQSKPQVFQELRKRMRAYHEEIMAAAPNFDLEEQRAASGAGHALIQ